VLGRRQKLLERLFHVYRTGALEARQPCSSESFAQREVDPSHRQYVPALETALVNGMLQVLQQALLQSRWQGCASHLTLHLVVQRLPRIGRLP
jgi:hypothetical protein